MNLVWQLLPKELLNTLYIVFGSALVAILVGLPLGVILTITGKGHLTEKRFLHKALSLVVNIGRSFPFAILIVALIPLTRLLAGTSIGTTASIVPLAIAAIPLAARIVEASLLEIDRHLIEAASIMGSSHLQLITKVMLPEAIPSLVLGFTSMIIQLIGYSTMTGLMGGGGLGKVAIQYGYYQFNPLLMGSTIVVLICLVQLIQWIGDGITQYLLKKRGKVTA